MLVDDELIRDHSRRLSIISNIVLIGFAIILSRLWYLQVYKGEILLKYSVQNRLRREKIRAPRGMIFSRNNFLMVDNTLRFDVVVTPQYLKDKKRVLPCAALCEGEFGINGYFIGVPTVIGKDGIEKILEFELEDSEKEELQNTLSAVKNTVQETGL